MRKNCEKEKIQEKLRKLQKIAPLKDARNQLFACFCEIWPFSLAVWWIFEMFWDGIYFFSFSCLRTVLMHKTKTFQHFNLLPEVRTLCRNNPSLPSPQAPNKFASHNFCVFHTFSFSSFLLKSFPWMLKSVLAGLYFVKVLHSLPWVRSAKP